MRKVMIMVVLSMVSCVSFAHAQTKTFTGSLLNPDRTGPFVITSTEERASNGGVVLETKTKTIGGGSAHFDITLDAVAGAPVSFDIYGYTKTESESLATVKHIVTCPGERFIEATSYPANGFPHIENLRAVGLCSFNPNGIDGATDGIAYLYMTGYLKKLSDTPDDIGKYVLSGTLGGGLNQSENNFVFKGSFGTVVKPTTR